MTNKSANHKQSEQALWQAFKGDQSMLARDQLIQHYDELAKIVASQCYAKRIDNNVEFSDYKQLGLIGLIEAIDRFDPSRGIAFNTFASHRIRGSILNGLGKLTEQRSQQAYQHKYMKDRIDALKIETETSENNTIQSFSDVAAQTINLALTSLLDAYAHHTSTQQQPSACVYQSKYMMEMSDKIQSVLEDLSEQEQTVIKSHYYQHMDFSDIANQLNVSRSRVSHLHQAALEKIRRELQFQSGLDEDM
ncbi:MAG: sigma-70 family RNA polymerase sigma factor [Gammaproteobacteria bacterium]|nr:sigma-70 family RNA polymerase sigma factor [Gammaproteobacteria bacterium]MDH5728571.1 sigma-70 family RNA polymerase sigma factor [Gammaproteobacteria bacterium]